jgi:hypothetical protein
MIDDTLGQDLHDRATRGKPLTDQEQRQLEEWYARKDREEAEMFAASALRSEEALRARIVETEQSIRRLLREIEARRRTNEELEAEVRALQALAKDRVPTAA